MIRAKNGNMDRKSHITHCPNGHAYNTDNMYYYAATNNRVCKSCRLAQAKARYQRLKIDAARPVVGQVILALPRHQLGPI